MKKLFHIIVLTGSVLFTLNLFAQEKLSWADSVLHALQTNESFDYGYKNAQCDTLLYLFEKEKDYCKWIEAMTVKSNYQINLGRINEALKSVNEAFGMYKSGNCQFPYMLSKIYYSYVLIYIELNEIEKARFYIENGIKSWQPEFKEKKTLIALYSCKGSLFSNIDSQLFYYQKAYELSIKASDSRLQQTMLNDIGTVYAETGDFSKARPFFEKAIWIGVNRKAYSSLSSLYNNMAGITDDVTLVSKYLDSAIHYARLKGNLDDIQAAYQNSALFYYDNKSYQRGYDFLWKSMELKDSIFNRDKINAFADMEQKYQAELKEQEITLLNEQNRNKAMQRNVLIIGFLALLIVSIIVMKQRNKVKHEKQRSDDLLLNILPSEIVVELKQNGQSAARQYNHVTVLFTDFVNFTGLSELMTPTELVAEIHQNFTAFDAIMEKHGLEKIKTIGDAYLAVCGLPNETHDHAYRVIKAAQEIILFMEQNKGKFQIRIGIHSGPVVAGIVGIKKFAYDIWGDTVNTASRMESSSEAGKINISKSTYELIKDEFDCEYRGKINVKNKGEVDMWFVNA